MKKIAGIVQQLSLGDIERSLYESHCHRVIASETREDLCRDEVCRDILNTRVVNLYGADARANKAEVQGEDVPRDLNPTAIAFLCGVSILTRTALR